MKKYALLFVFSVFAYGFFSGKFAPFFEEKDKKAVLLDALKEHKKLVHPIVLVHGASMGGARLKIGPLDYGPYWKEISEFLGASGTRVAVAEMPTDSSIGERAALLGQFLDSEFKGQQVNIIAHSLGGLDARYLVSILKSNKVVSITTIATPHYGSPLANWAVRQAKYETLWYKFFWFFGFDLKGRRFLGEITTNFMQKTFNEKVQNRPDVHYYSVACWGSFENKTMSWLLWFPHRWLTSENDPLAKDKNDGLVPKSSQLWGRAIREFELDHLGQINHHGFRFHDMRNESLGMYWAVYDYLQKEGL